jgi:hypothetical protein
MIMVRGRYVDHVQVGVSGELLVRSVAAGESISPAKRWACRAGGSDGASSASSVRRARSRAKVVAIHRFRGLPSECGGLR